VLDVRARPGTNGRARRHGTPTSVGREHKRAHGSNATKFENIHIHTGEILFLCVRCLRAFFFFFFFSSQNLKAPKLTHAANTHTHHTVSVSVSVTTVCDLFDLRTREMLCRFCLCQYYCQYDVYLRLLRVA